MIGPVTRATTKCWIFSSLPNGREISTAHRSREAAGAPAAAALPGVRRRASRALPLRFGCRRRRGHRRGGEGPARAGPSVRQRRARRQAPGAGARGGHVRRRRPRRPRRLPSPRGQRDQRRGGVLDRLRGLRRRAGGCRAAPGGRRRGLRPARQVGGRRRLPSRHQGEQQASRDRRARTHRLARRTAARRLRGHHRLPLEVAQAVRPLQVLPVRARPRRRQRRPVAVLRAHRGHQAHGQPGGHGGARQGRRADQRRPGRPRRRAGAGEVPPGGRHRRRRPGRVRERAGRAAGAVRHGQRRAVGPQGRDDAGVHPRRARPRHG